MRMPARPVATSRGARESAHRAAPRRPLSGVRGRSHSPGADSPRATSAPVAAPCKQAAATNSQRPVRCRRGPSRPVARVSSTPSALQEVARARRRNRAASASPCPPSASPVRATASAVHIAKFHWKMAHRAVLCVCLVVRSAIPRRTGARPGFPVSTTCAPGPPAWGTHAAQTRRARAAHASTAFALPTQGKGRRVASTCNHPRAIPGRTSLALEHRARILASARS